MEDIGGPDEGARRSTAVSRPWSGLVRWIVGLLLIGHGLIHVLGPLATWGLADIEALTGDPTIDMGAATDVVALAWLIALVMLVIAGAAVLARRTWWRTLAAIGVIVSQATIFMWWDDAAAGTAANLLVVAAVVFARPLGLDFRAADGSG